MIFVPKENISEKDFIGLLERTKETILGPRLSQLKGIGPDKFEDLVFETIKETAVGTTFEGSLIHTNLYDFPDIIAKKYFGAEVKVTVSDKWVSTGNSILEATRDKDVKKIFIFFGKLGGTPDIKFRNYSECLYGVGVTHSPRYKINMELPVGQSIFDKIGVEYDDLRQNSPIAQIKAYYRAQLKEGDELWWIDQQIEDTAASPVIRSFKNLSEEEQRGFIVEAMILFPEMFSPNNSKFERAAAYLVTRHNAVSSSFRDMFSAGGKVELKIGNQTSDVPRIIENLRKHAKEIDITINSLNEEELKNYWRVDLIKKDRIGQWKDLLDAATQSLEFKPSKIFEAGLI